MAYVSYRIINHLGKSSWDGETAGCGLYVEYLGRVAGWRCWVEAMSKSRMKNQDLADQNHEHHMNMMSVMNHKVGRTEDQDV